MPVLRFKPGRVEEVLRLPLTEALRVVERLKVEAEILPDGMVEMEIEVDRPDMYILEGIARQANGLLGRETGLAAYRAENTGIRVVVDEVSTRPYIAAAVVWDVNVDEDYLEELIQFQEKLHTSLGGRRELVAIGLHDLDKLPSKTLYYKFEPVEEIRFEPLGGGGVKPLSAILEETEQGRKYGSLSLREGRHPVLYSGSEVISVPPVINAELTRVEPGTRHLFIDVTGVNRRFVHDALAILATTIAERSRRRRIGLVEIEKTGGGTEKTPRLEPRGMSLDVRYASRVLGVELSSEEAARHLLRMRFGVKEQSEGRTLPVLVPAYRIDVLHPVDLVEEIALSIGIEELGYTKPDRMLRGRLLAKRSWEKEARKLLAGMGFVEIVTYSLVSCERQRRYGGIGENELVVLENPIGVESSCLRATLMPGLLEVAAQNQHYVPLRVFETGEVVVKAPGMGDRGVGMRSRLAILYMADKAGYEDIQGYVYALLRGLGDEIVEVKPAKHPVLIDGRAARARTLQGIELVMGEVKPELLEQLGIEYPVAVAELDYTSLRPPQAR
jgi:phenylalanyl-tRNA synthetase beta chain